MKALVFDDSALTALFGAHEYVFALWQRAEKAGVAVLLPTTAIYGANLRLRFADQTWEAVLLAEHVRVLELTAARAVRASLYGDDPVVAQVSVEAIDTNATIVTARPEVFDPLLPIASFTP